MKSRSTLPDLHIFGTVAQRFITQNRVNRYEDELKRGSIYTLTNFFGSNNKVMYRVADQKLMFLVTLSWLMASLSINVRLYAPRMAQLLGKLWSTCSLKIKWLGPVVNIYLWDQAAENFRRKFDESVTTPTVLLVTTLHEPSATLTASASFPHAYQLTGKLCLSSMSSSRVFLDQEVDPTKEYLNWLVANPASASLVNAVEVVNVETLTIREIAAFIKHQPAQIAYFDCIATIDDVKLGTECYYIACKVCQTKLTHGPTTLMCPKCCNENATASANFRVELSVYDNEEQCTFIILGDAGKELAGRNSTELIDMYAEENGADGADHEVPLPRCFIDTIGQTHKFRIKVSHFSFTSKKLSLTVTKIVSPAVLPPKDRPADMPALPIYSSQDNPAACAVDSSMVTESSGGGSSYANTDPNCSTDEQKKPKRIRRNDSYQRQRVMNKDKL
ncbi:hypothetical protein HID58_043480 [Brassica napus]|uniref:Replication factor A C-terminal domain-containing protein n=1 Tax=Brassica napus TaxID=3708 RepID=A0ABQ8BGM0_BRANA|nr:hypothetical protein HID58_043480 [Brassica napus]